MKSGKIEKVAAVAKLEEQKSASELGTHQKKHQQKRDQLEQLVQFKEEYELALGAKGSEGMAAKQLQDYRLFLNKLNQAIDQQTLDIQVSKDGLESVQAQWISKSQRKMALDHLLDERHREQVKGRKKIEQQDSDEQSMNRNVTAGDP